MFEVAKVGRKVDKQTFKNEEPDLRTRLLEAQIGIEEEQLRVVVIVAGMEGAGKGEVVNRLNEWLDTRGVQVHAFWEPSDEERERPRFWRFWRSMPPKGEISVMFGGWYQEPIEQRFLDDFRDFDDSVLERELRRIREHERMLVEDGVLLVKFWYHFSEDVQRKRLKKLSRNDRSHWKMLPEKKSGLAEHYKQYEHVADQVIRRTDIGRAPWHVIEAADERYRDLTTGRTLLQILEQRLGGTKPEHEPEDEHVDSDLPDAPEARITLLDTLDLSQSLKRDEYRHSLKALQDELNNLTWAAYKQRRSTVMVFEGVDAGGKGGAIRRLTQAMDARLYRTISIAAPTDEEQAHHYLWRFWRQIPRAGYMTLFDRSWYGRVLVERVEGLTRPARWRRAYMEINDFEDQLCEHGIIVVKFWLQISKDEQLARFQAREHTAYKRYKITDEDWRNRERWDEYRVAVNEMLERTSTERAPWTLIAGNDKRYARVRVLTHAVQTIRLALGQR